MNGVMAKKHGFGQEVICVKCKEIPLYPFELDLQE